MIKAVSFDLYKTLVQFWPPLDEVQQAACRELGLHVCKSAIKRGYAVADTVRSGRVDRGILICGSGVGASVTANKVPGIRACVCHDTYTGHQGVEHDDMNVLCLGARVVGIELSKEILGAFLSANFIPEPRFQRRLDKLLLVEKKWRGENTS